jgi:predicted nucleic acid-binding protein
MILLDTNVVSEPFKPRPDLRVASWFNGQALETLYLSTMTVAELRAGVALLPAGKRRDRLHENLETRVLPLFTGRVLPFDLVCTKSYAEVMATARSSGVTIETADACIAAVAHANGFTVATRDTTPFEGVGLTVINPFD